jgi:hypothetical protein
MRTFPMAPMGRSSGEITSDGTSGSCPYASNTFSSMLNAAAAPAEAAKPSRMKLRRFISAMDDTSQG